MTPETTLFVLNITITFLAYFWLYPRAVGNHLVKLTIFNTLVCLTSFMIAGALFWGKEITFGALGFTTNWFWFNLLSYSLLETPLAYWYLKKNSPWDSSNH
ncbi:MAG: hypothetical protein AAGB12_05940 [Pseudomonadota bacterium]